MLFSSQKVSFLPIKYACIALLSVSYLVGSMRLMGGRRAISDAGWETAHRPYPALAACVFMQARSSAALIIISYGPPCCLPYLKCTLGKGKTLLAQLLDKSTPSWDSAKPLPIEKRIHHFFTGIPSGLGWMLTKEPKVSHSELSLVCEDHFSSTPFVGPQGP